MRKKYDLFRPFTTSRASPPSQTKTQIELKVRLLSITTMSENGRSFFSRRVQNSTPTDTEKEEVSGQEIQLEVGIP